MFYTRIDQMFTLYFQAICNLFLLTLQISHHQPCEFIDLFALWLIGLDFAQHYQNMLFLVYVSSCLHMRNSKL